jgi:hypothetical protein
MATPDARLSLHGKPAEGIWFRRSSAAGARSRGVSAPRVIVAPRHAFQGTRSKGRISTHEGKRSAERRVFLPAASSRMRLRAFALGALAFRRSTATFAAGLMPQLSPRPRFHKTRLSWVLPKIHLSQFSELLADRSSCRTSGVPEPPGSGVTTPARRHRTLLPLQGSSREAPFT